MNGDFKGDFSRLRFDSTKQYAALFKQQGRVDLDSDDFEQHQIDLRQRQTTNTDVIGQYGGPAANAGFQINVSGNQILISPGPYYVRGIEAENQNQLSYDAQPYLINPANTASALLAQLRQASQGATLGMVLQVWQRLVTTLDDPSLQEPALGQADTTVRLQTVWRVIGTLDTSAPPAASAAQPGNPISQKTPSCQALYAASQASTLQHTGTMSAALAQAGADSGCSPIAAGGYQGLENQLYRVEIHKGGALSSATFKWSRENASVVVAVTGVNGAAITVASLGPDANLGFQAGQWVELSDDTNLFGPTPNQPGTLYQIQSINQTTVTLQSTTTPSIDPKKNARMRRWDQTDASATSSGIPVSSTAIAVENGILVTFGGGEFQPGDYWTIPARTANGQIDWPQSSGSGGSFQPPSYVQIYQAPLACISLQQQTTGGQTSLQPQASDCRLLFPSLVTVNNVTPPALHVQAYSWANDDVITVDTLLQQGLSITFDQPPTCPWSSANFQVVLETPAKAPIGLGTVVRATYALDPPFGVTVSGNQVVWLPQQSADPGLFGALEAWILFNNLLNYNNSPAGPGRVRIRLDGGAVYSTGPSGTVYLDGQTFGSTATRASDGSPCITLNTPSGNSAKASDFEGWFYLAPTLFIQNVAIQGVTSTNQASNITQVTVSVITEKF